MQWDGEHRNDRRIADRYHLLEPIGQGGMGVVWRAHDELLDRTVAVKEVRYGGGLGDEKHVLNRRMMREARAAARLTHPNVVVVYDVIEEDHRPWIVMQLVPSRSLGQVIRADGPLKPRRVADIGLQVLDALRGAHRAGVLHRDVKPENVLLAHDGRVVLTDFGIATLETETALTMTGLAGTPAFIAPERLRGLPARRESDLWSLGATLYAAVEGKSPHDRGMAMATMHSVLNDAPALPRNAGPLFPVLDGLLRKEPVQRLTYDEAADMLRKVMEGHSPTMPFGVVAPRPPAASPAAEPIPETGHHASPARPAGPGDAGKRPGRNPYQGQGDAQQGRGNAQQGRGDAPRLRGHAPVAGTVRPRRPAPPPEPPAADDVEIATRKSRLPGTAGPGPAAARYGTDAAEAPATRRPAPGATSESRAAEKSLLEPSEAVGGRPSSARSHGGLPEVDAPRTPSTSASGKTAKGRKPGAGGAAAAGKAAKADGPAPAGAAAASGDPLEDDALTSPSLVMPAILDDAPPPSGGDAAPGMTVTASPAKGKTGAGTASTGKAGTSAAKSGTGKAASGTADAAKSGTGKSGTGAAGKGKPGTGQAKTGSGSSDADTSDAGKPGRSSSGKSADKSRIAGPGTDVTDTDKSGTSGPDANAGKPGTADLYTDTAGTDKSATSDTGSGTPRSTSSRATPTGSDKSDLPDSGPDDLDTDATDTGTPTPGKPGSATPSPDSTSKPGTSRTGKTSTGKTGTSGPDTNAGKPGTADLDTDTTGTDTAGTDTAGTDGGSLSTGARTLGTGSSRTAPTSSDKSGTSGSDADIDGLDSDGTDSDAATPGKPGSAAPDLDTASTSKPDLSGLDTDTSDKDAAETDTASTGTAGTGSMSASARKPKADSPDNASTGTGKPGASGSDAADAAQPASGDPDLDAADAEAASGTAATGKARSRTTGSGKSKSGATGSSATGSSKAGTGKPGAGSADAVLGADSPASLHENASDSAKNHDGDAQHGDSGDADRPRTAADKPGKPSETGKVSTSSARSGGAKPAASTSEAEDAPPPESEPASPARASLGADDASWSDSGETRKHPTMGSPASEPASTPASGWSSRSAPGSASGADSAPRASTSAYGKAEPKAASPKAGVRDEEAVAVPGLVGTPTVRVREERPALDDLPPSYFGATAKLPTPPLEQAPAAPRQPLADAQSTVMGLRPSMPPRRSSPLRKVVPAVTVAVVIVAGVSLYLGMRSGEAVNPAPPEVTTSASAAPSTAEPEGGRRPAATPAEPAEPTATPAEKPAEKEEKDALPAGWKMYKDKKMGFSVGLPPGWKELSRTGSWVRFRGPGASPSSYLHIEEASEPGGDPLKDWRRQEPTLKYNFGGYKKLWIKKVDYQKAAADWEFTWRANSGKSRVRNRGFVTDNGRAYAIYWHTRSNKWKEHLRFFNGFADTFKPAK
ncbi:Serine/threonine protein kinase [Sinosporangium album]|uniref:Serine/threonine protein kinase n=1 Tax=Sinosporangium album TaxID=504805 RepID=A0A1G7XAP8_9ACTN|nr:protein kinase [Sinosporangium album]SDG81302.1 Serine/threonine protein kinase [Sinosporangium album]